VLVAARFSNFNKDVLESVVISKSELKQQDLSSINPSVQSPAFEFATYSYLNTDLSRCNSFTDPHDLTESMQIATSRRD
jgi:hypothetical protein